MGFITLIKTAEENITGFTVISSVKVEEYVNIDSLFEILKKRVYSFAIHGKNSGILTLATDFSSNDDVLIFLSKHWNVFKDPGTKYITEFNTELLAKFVYKCGHDDGFYDRLNNHPEV